MLSKVSTKSSTISRNGLVAQFLSKFNYQIEKNYFDRTVCYQISCNSLNRIGILSAHLGYTPIPKGSLLQIFRSIYYQQVQLSSVLPRSSTLECTAVSALSSAEVLIPLYTVKPNLTACFLIAQLLNIKNMPNRKKLVYRSNYGIN